MKIKKIYILHTSFTVVSRPSCRTFAFIRTFVVYASSIVFTWLVMQTFIKIYKWKMKYWLSKIKYTFKAIYFVCCLIFVDFVRSSHPQIKINNKIKTQSLFIMWYTIKSMKYNPRDSIMKQTKMANWN